MCDRESQIPQDVLDGTCYSLQEYFGVHKIEDLYVFRVGTSLKTHRKAEENRQNRYAPGSDAAVLRDL